MIWWDTWQFNVVMYLIFVVAFAENFKPTVAHDKNNDAATVVLQFAAAASMVFLIPFFPFKYSANPQSYVLILVACFFYALFDRLQTVIRKNLEVSQYSIISQIFFVFLIVYGVVLFHDPLPLSRIVGACIILAGNFLLIYRKGNFKPNKYVWLALAANFLGATAATVDIGLSGKFNLPFYIMCTFFLSGTIVMAIDRMPLGKVLYEFTSGNKTRFLITGALWGLSTYFALKAFQFGKVSEIVPLQATSVLLNVVVAYLLLHERDAIAKKVLAACLVIAGIILTVV